MADHMLSHVQMAFVLTRLVPQLKMADSGSKFLVGMPVRDATQTGEAFVHRWEVPGVPCPSIEAIRAEWEKPDTQAAYQAAHLE